MKLRNRLIPLASCLAVGATVAPITLTACANSSIVDLKDGFIPTIKKLAVDGYTLTKTEAQKRYFNAISENPEIFIQDYNWSISSALRAIETYGTEELSASTLNSAKAKITNFKTGKTVIDGDEVPTLSFDYVREQSYTLKTNDQKYYTGSELTTVTNTKYVFSVKNIPCGLNLNNRKLFVGSATGESLPGMDKLYYYAGRGITSSHNDILWDSESPIVYSPWILSLDTYSLQYMTDSWYADITMEIDDTYSLIYNDVKTTASDKRSFSYKFNDFEQIAEIMEDREHHAEAYAAIQELESWRIKSYYLQDITVTK